MKVDVIILSLCKDRSFYDLNVKCIESLIESEEEITFNILVVESNPDWRSLQFSYPFDNVRVLELSEPFNYNRSLNLGVKSTRENLIVFCNNDLIFHKGWMSKILDVKKMQPSIQSFCPFDRMSHHLDIQKFDKKEFHIGYRVPFEFVGWCFVVERSVFSKTGLFDESFDFYFQDKDFANTLKKHEIVHAMVPSSFVQHMGGFTTGEYDASTTDKYVQDKIKYTKKWGTEPVWKRIANKLSTILGIK